MEVCPTCEHQCAGGYVYNFYKCSESGKILRWKTEKELKRIPREFDLFINPNGSFQFPTKFYGFNFL
jgi:hypothetical protein